MCVCVCVCVCVHAFVCVVTFGKSHHGGVNNMTESITFPKWIPGVNRVRDYR